MPALLTLLAAGPAAAGSVADLEVAVTDTPDPVAPGGALAYEATVRNGGPDAATDVLVTSILPSAVTFERVALRWDLALFRDGFESGDLGGWNGVAGSPCQVAGRIVSCALGFLASQESVVVRIEVTVAATATGPLVYSVTAGSSSTDPDPANDSAGASTALSIPRADLSLTMSDSPDPVRPGQLLTYTLTVANFGPSEAPGTELIDALPPEVTFVSSSHPCFEQDGLRVCQLGNLTSGQVVDATITVQVGSKAAVSLTNPAAVGSSAVDPNPGNNQDDEITEVSRP